jgi:(p)ppGpp synthase/HD superfamily hydrolase
MSTLQRAIEIAIEAHKGQTDKAGKPYILHIFQVMAKGKSEDEKITALLHDTVEDTPWTLDKLEAEGFSHKIIEALDCLTKREGESYEEFIERVKSNPLAIKVKINDLEDNMDIRRLRELSDNDVNRLNKYIKAYRELVNYN